MVLVHELGHFFAARRVGIFVEEFAMGMGPKLWSKKGEYIPGEVYKTTYSIRLFPIGGFCKMLGEDENTPDEPRALNNKSVGKRMIVMAAGAFMNFILAFVIFLLINILTGFNVPAVRAVIEDSPAEQAGLTAGDVITHVNGSRIMIYEDFSFELMTADGSPINITINRDGSRLNLLVTPKLDESGMYKFGFYPQGRIGLLGDVPEGFTRVGIFDSTATAFNRVVTIVKMTFVGIYRLATNQLNGAGLSGMIGITQGIGQAYEDVNRANDAVAAPLGARIFDITLTMLNLCAFISANLGIMNLLPLPALDGGRLVFLLYEIIRRKPFPPEREGAVHFVGFVLLMILAVFIAYQDIMKLL